jgi:hypothetical protein
MARGENSSAFPDPGPLLPPDMEYEPDIPPPYNYLGACRKTESEREREREREKGEICGRHTSIFFSVSPGLESFDRSIILRDFNGSGL